MSGEVFVGVSIQGGLIPADLPSQLASGRDPQGNTLSPKDYHLAAGETVRDAANRVWAYLLGAWTGYRDALAQLPADAPTTALTRERFLLILLDQLGYGRVPPTGKGGLRVDGRSFPVSHQWGATPIHLLGAGTPLDTRTKGLAGAAGSSPQSLVQELLNRSDDHLWGILANGEVLRLLRDSTSLVGSAYVEFDLEAIFDGELFSDFLLLYTLCQASRLETRDPDLGPSSCRLESWRTMAIETGSRALNLLRDGVAEALRTLGTGFLTHPDNSQLRDDLESGRVTVYDVNHALLRVVYRLMFTFVAEDRGALLDPAAETRSRKRYLDYFATSRLRATSRRRRGGRYGDRWQALVLLWQGLGTEGGLPELGLPGIGGLFEPGELDFLTECELSNEALLSAVRSLSLVRERKSGVLRHVDYRNLGAEELGSIYEALLEFVPHWDSVTKRYSLDVASGNQRKDTGSYYTPTSLVESLLDTALDPVLDDAVKSADDSDGQLAALLRVTVCDPACGSGHFLVGAARRIAKRVAALRTGDPEPAPEQVRSAMRDVVGNCIYGVDVNPLAAELAKVSLWLEAIEPGRPLAYLDAQIKVGNALVGATPALLAEGLPDVAFKPIEGDEKTIATATTRANKAERANQGSLFDLGDVIAGNTALAEKVTEVIGVEALSLSDIHVQRQRLKAFSDSDEYRTSRLAADAWCAAFVWPLHDDAPEPITHSTINALIAGSEVLSDRQAAEIDRLVGQYRFFHWHLEFPHIFPTTPAAGDSINIETGWAGGFSVVIGNPPWERVKLQEQEFFAARDPRIATAANAAARKRLIADLKDDNPGLYREFLAEKRRSEGISHLLRTSGRYPLTGRGDVNTYAVFAETDRSLLAGSGRLGVILPTGIATDATTQYFFKDLVENGSIASLYDFENRKPLFGAVDSRFKFCLLTLAGRDTREPRADFAFFAHDPTDLQRPDTRFTLSPEEIKLLNPNTGTCPVFGSRRDAEITLGIYNRVPVLIREGDPDGNPWGIKFMRMFDMSNDSHLFHTREELEDDGWVLEGNVFERRKERMLPLYEAKMIAAYDHRAADVVKSATAAKRQNQPRYLTEEEHGDPKRLAIPIYWVSQDEVPDTVQPWLLSFLRITSPTNHRTFVSSAIPRTAAGDSVFLIEAPNASQMLGCFNSFVFDYVARQKLAGLNMLFYIVKQLPVLDAGKCDSAWNRVFRGDVVDWVNTRVLELSYTAEDMEAFARSLSYRGSPYAWDSSRRSLLRSELDAIYFHLYGLLRDDVDYIMDTFPIVKRKDEAELGEYRTKRMILEIYDAMQDAIDSGGVYESPLDVGDHQPRTRRAR
ncbi:MULTISPECIES: Eco57I restriction-modification methylase domain-containing protein [unclassified Gordonia (in: high G+C Gram-positive bacteria)]|uniref:Eco57I restriction-modification methylase domain-containing protein n=1 Tax=unclassified Gordonia (in: high G+C Gram-positive bacteria) TaxID=2657482 RepID=UPI001CF9D892|nr:N-6 DNA methylase [Gordonia sp. WA4-43]UCZ89288.1 N-6 DNA methylase [Gordonia sp. WA4-43]